MGLRGPGARPLGGRYRQNYYAEPAAEPGPSPRRLKLLQRLQTLAHGTDLSVELADHGRVSVSAAPTRMEALIMRERALLTDGESSSVGSNRPKGFDPVRGR
jgi:hypothetical protein